MTTDRLRKAFDRARAASEHRAWIRGLVGKPNGDGTYTTVVANRPGYVYVRTSQSGVLTVTIAKSLGKVALRGNLPIKMLVEPGIGLVIHELDELYHEASTSADATNVYGVAQHTHALDSGTTYLIESQRMQPGLVHTAGGWVVTVEAFRYKYNGTWQTFAGDTLTLLSKKPSTTGKHRLVVVVLDPSSNTLDTVNGSDEDYATALTQETIDGITIGDTYPLGAVIMREDDSSIEAQAKYIDARGWLNYSDDETGGALSVWGRSANSSGTRADISATASTGYVLRETSGALGFGTIGASAIADGSITDDKLRNSGALSVIGRSANSTGDPADISATPASGAVLRESGSVLGFGTIGAAAIPDGLLANAKLADMSEARVKGRAAGAGTGAPQDLTAVQMQALVGGVMYIDNNGDGNVDAGEDTLATYTIAANRLVGLSTLYFEIVGKLQANGNSKRIRLYFGGSAIFDFTTTTASDWWTLRGRVMAVGDSSQKVWSWYTSESQTEYQHYELTVSSASTIDVTLTGEATTTDDIVCETMLLTWTPPFV